MQELLPDTKLRHYRIVSKISAGGMGEVYLAEDAQLKRKVALKLLFHALNQNEDSLRRFRQEAQAISALNHPNIVTVYEIGEWKDRQFIAMEFVEGSNLRHLIQNREISLDAALDIAIQTAAALAAAHAAGIVHRDIKPENIVRRPDGLVKVLDFGLAKRTIISPDQNQINPEATTWGQVNTAPGLLLGTAAYMSPEQARGKETDERTDVWSLGVVLYEMITGRSPFAGETKSDMLAAILKSEPPTLSLHAPGVPQGLDHIIKKALGKNCEERYQVVKDLLLDLKIFQGELKTAASGPQRESKAAFPTEKMLAKNTEPQEALDSPPLSDRRWLWLAVPLLVLLMVLPVWYFRQKPTLPKMDLAALASSQIASWKSELGEDSSNRAQFSPDGKLVAFVASRNGKNSVWLKQIGGGEPFTRKQDEAEEKSPIWSPDGTSIAYFSDRGSSGGGGRRGIWMMPALGGADPACPARCVGTADPLVERSFDDLFRDATKPLCPCRRFKADDEADRF
jgi:serine/threonine protein kinase